MAPSRTLLLLSSTFLAFTALCAESPPPPPPQTRRTYHLVTYATRSHRTGAERLLRSAVAVGGFSEGRVYGPADLDAGFRARNAAILSQPRGAGYWLYKPYILMHYMTHTAAHGDVVCYMDAMYEFQALFTPLVASWITPRPHIGLAHNKPVEHTAPEKEWSKRDAFLLMGIDEAMHRESNQAWCGFVALPKSLQSVLFIAEWLTYTQDARIVTDAPSTLLPESPDFIENRHDQTVCSLIAKKWGVHFQDFPPEPVYNHHLLGS